MVNVMNTNLGFTKADVMLGLYIVSNRDEGGKSKNNDCDVFDDNFDTYETTKLRVKIWYLSKWVEVTDLSLRKSYLIYDDKLFNTYFIRPYDCNFLYNERFTGVFTINGERTICYIDSNGLVRDDKGKFLTKLKTIDW